MKALFRFSRATLVGGLLFVIPLVALGLIVHQAFQIVSGVLRPIGRLLPTERLGGIVATDALALLALIALCFAAGLIISTSPGRALSARLENLVLRRIPGFTLAKTLAHGFTGLEGGSDVKTAMVRLDDTWILAFVVERGSAPGGLVTVFVPSAPTPAVGSIQFVEADRVHVLDVPMMTAVQSIMQLGVGSKALLDASARPLAGPAAGDSPGASRHQ